MAHSSLPIYLDPPNWHQQSNQQPTNDHQDPRQLPPFLPPPPPHVGGATGSIRPGSMAYRARLAMIPQPEAALKCPRCESINTKFCYFNNYSLSQPRHFCKTCRRYWTLGGALRNVPVGGGFRKNKKKKKSNRSKSPAATESEIGNSRSNGGIISAGCNIGSSTIGRLPSPQLPSMASLQILPRLGAGNSGSGLNFNGIQIGNMNSSGGDLDQWRSQQYPFIISGLDSPATAAAAAYPFIQTDQANFGVNNSSASAIQYCHQFQNLTPFSRETNHQLKNEEKQNQDQGILPNFLRPPAATVTENNNQFWTGHDQNSWTDLSALSSSSSSRLL